MQVARESILSLRSPHKDMKTRLCACLCKFDELTLICTGTFQICDANVVSIP